MSNEFPKRMVHPSHQKGTTRLIDPTNPRSGYQGTPDRFPPVTVNTPDQEAQHRAQGYVAHGESAANTIDYQRYPMMLTHPDHEPAVEVIQDYRDAQGRLLQKGSPGKPEKLPAVTVTSEEEEAEWLGKGYRIPGKPDPDAVQLAKSVPYVPGRSAQEYPKIVNGVLVQDPNIPSDVQQYPKWISIADHPHGGVVVNSAEAEEEILGPKPKADKVAVAKAKREAALRAKEQAEAALAAAEAEIEDEDDESEDIDALRSKAQSLGLDVKPTWNARTIEKRIKEAQKAA